MPIADINYVSVLIAAVINMALGALWYSPVLFGKSWSSMMGWTAAQSEAAKKGATKAYAINFIGALVMAYVLAHFVDYMEATDALLGAQTGFWLWLGFVAPILLGSILWENKPTKFYAINVGYYLVALVINGALIAVMG
jgi:hypothetical protein